MKNQYFLEVVCITLMLLLAACGGAQTGSGTPQSTAAVSTPIVDAPSVPEETPIAQIPSDAPANVEIPAMTGSSQLIATIDAQGESNLGLTIVQAAGAEKAVRVYDFDDAGACIRYVQIYSYNSVEDAALWYDNFLIGEGVTLEDATVVEVKEGADIAPEYETLEKVQAFCEVFQVPYEMK